MRMNGRRAALAAASMGAVVLCFAVYHGTYLIREGYWIDRLDSTKGEKREEAAAILADMGAVRAAPHLIRAIRENTEEHISRTGRPGLSTEPDMRPRRFATPLIHALWRLGDRGVPEIEKAAVSIAEAGYNDERMYRILLELTRRKAPPMELDGPQPSGRPILMDPNAQRAP